MSGKIKLLTLLLLEINTLHHKFIVYAVFSVICSYVCGTLLVHTCRHNLQISLCTSRTWMCTSHTHTGNVFLLLFSPWFVLESVMALHWWTCCCRSCSMYEYTCEMLSCETLMALLLLKTQKWRPGRDLDLTAGSSNLLKTWLDLTPKSTVNSSNAGQVKLCSLSSFQDFVAEEVVWLRSWCLLSVYPIFSFCFCIV